MVCKYYWSRTVNIWGFLRSAAAFCVPVRDCRGPGACPGQEQGWDQPQEGSQGQAHPGCASVTGLGPAALPQVTDQHPTAALGQARKGPGRLMAADQGCKGLVVPPAPHRHGPNKACRAIE